MGEVRIGLRKTDGYINATAICKACDKRVNNYLRTQETLAFLMETSQQEGLPIEELTIVRKGGDDEQGTWVHPIVAINLAQWASAEFAYAVAKWIIDWFHEARSPLSLSDALQGVAFNNSVQKSASVAGPEFQPQEDAVDNKSEVLEVEAEPDIKQDISFFTTTYTELLAGAKSEHLLPDIEQRKFASLRRKLMLLCERRMRDLT